MHGHGGELDGSKPWLPLALPAQCMNVSPAVHPHDGCRVSKWSSGEATGEQVFPVGAPLLQQDPPVQCGSVQQPGLCLEMEDADQSASLMIPASPRPWCSKFQKLALLIAPFI